MNIEFRRIIVPAGFGSFCLEYFNNEEGKRLFTVVYDCGAWRKEGKANIKDAIDKYITSKNAVVDALFISHFHADHINCIAQLPLDKKTKVFVPYLKDIQNWDVYMAANDIDSDVYKGCIRHLELKGVKFVLVNELLDVWQKNESIAIENIQGDIQPYGQIEGVLFSSGQSVCAKAIPFWTYTPFHVQDSTVFNNFLIETTRRGITTKQLSQYDGTDKDFKKRLREIYNDVSKKITPLNDSALNASTMLLISQKYVSGNIVKNWFWHCRKTPTDGTYRVLYHPIPETKLPNDRGTGIYTGDICLSHPPFWGNFTRLVNQEVNTLINLLQIPHHGSEQSYNKSIFSRNDICALFINNDIGNTKAKFYPQIMADAHIHNTPLYIVDAMKNCSLEHKLRIDVP